MSTIDRPSFPNTSSAAESAVRVSGSTSGADPESGTPSLSPATGAPSASTWSGTGSAEQSGSLGSAGNDVQHQGAVSHRAHERSYGVERPGSRHHPMQADAAPGRAYRRQPAQRGGPSERSSGVGSERSVDQPRGDRRGGTAGRPARGIVGVPGIETVSEMEIVSGSSGGEFAHVQPADIDGTRAGEAFEHGGRLGSPDAVEDPGPAGRNPVLSREQVLVRHRHTMQRTHDLARRQHFVGLSRLCPGGIGVKGDKTVESSGQTLRARQTGLGRLQRGDSARTDFGGNRGQVEIGDLHFSQVSFPRLSRGGIGRSGTSREPGWPADPPAYRDRAGKSARGRRILTRVDGYTTLFGVQIRR